MRSRSSFPYDTALGLSLILAASFFGCGGGGSASSPAGNSGASPRTIQGRSGQTLIYGSSETRVPTDLSTIMISALTPSGNTYTTINGSGSADGTFSIPGVPSGTCFVKVQPPSGFPTFYQVDGATLELESSALGDPAVPLASQTSTYLLLDPASPGMSVSAFDLISVKSGVVQSVSSSHTSTPIGWKGKPLLDTSRETDLIITGLASASTVAGDTYRFITGYDMSFIGPFAMVDGATTSASANLIIQGTPSSASATVDRNAFCGIPLATTTASNPR